MRFIVSPILKASVLVNGEERSIGRGLLIYMGISKEDNENGFEKCDKFAGKIGKLKIIHNENDDKIDQSLEDIGGEIMIISNFTIYGKNKKGTKIDFIDSACFSDAKNIYDYLIKKLKENYSVKTGEFGGKMEISSVNHGPLNYIFEY